MKAQTAPAGNRELRVTIELEGVMVESALKRAAGAAAQTMAIPGFRSSKVPYRAIERYVGRSALLASVQEELADQVLDGFLEDNPLGELEYTELEDMQDDPVTFTFRLVLEPYVQLGDYSELRVAPHNLELTEEDRQQAKSQVLDEFMELEQSEEAADWDDWIILEVNGVVLDVEGQPTEEVALDQENWEFALSKENVMPPSFLQEKVIGMEPGHERSFDMVCPAEGLEGHAGKLMRFELKLKSVNRWKRPEWNQDLLASFLRMEKDRGTLAEYEAALWDLVRHAKVIKVFEEELAEAWAKLAKISVIEFAKYSLDFQVETQIQRYLQTHGYLAADDLDAYLDSSGMTIEELRKTFEAEAASALKRELLLEKFTEKQQFEIPEELHEQLELEATEFATRMSNLSPEEDKRDAQERFRNNLLWLSKAEALLEVGRNAMLEIVTEGAHSLEEFYAKSPAASFAELIDVKREWRSEAET